MAKDGGKVTTTWIWQSEAKAQSVEYLGDPDFVERKYREHLAAGKIPWDCEHFEAPPQYSGPGPGDPEFWKFEGQLRTRDGSAVIVKWREIHTEGNSAIRTDDATAKGIKYDRSALVRLKLLLPDDVEGDGDSSRPEKRKSPQVDRVMWALSELYPAGIDGIPDADVRRKVANHLQPETKKGLPVPDRRSMNRAIRQYRNGNR
jgi:hypothetical protein